MKFNVLRINDFRVIFAARIFAVLGLQAQAVIVGWHVYELTRDPLWLGMIGLTEAAPAILFAFLSGHVVDNRRAAAVYRLSVFVLLLNTIGLWFCAWPGAPLTEPSRLFLLFAAVFISGVVRSFTSPALFTLFSHIVPKRLQAEASAWNSWSFQSAAITGPALGGLIYGKFGPTVAFAFPAVAMLCCFISFHFLSAETRAMRSQTKREDFVSSVRAGIRFVLQQKILLSAMALDMLSVLFGGAVAILPMFSDQVLHAGSEGLGWLRAAPSVGSGLVALCLAIHPLQVISGRMLLSMVAGFGAATVLFAFSQNFTMAFVCLAASGAFDGVSMVIRSTILQLLTPDHMRGRVSALSLIFITSSNEIGAFESGVAARFLGLIPSIIFGGTMTLVIVTLTAWKVPALRHTRIRPGEENP
jgi:MFS family permease